MGDEFLETPMKCVDWFHRVLVIHKFFRFQGQMYLSCKLVSCHKHLMCSFPIVDHVGNRNDMPFHYNKDPTLQ